MQNFCETGKIIYPDYKSAYEALKRIKSRAKNTARDCWANGRKKLSHQAIKKRRATGSKNRKETSIHACDQCGGYHLTSHNKNKKRSMQ